MGKSADVAPGEVQVAESKKQAQLLSRHRKRRVNEPTEHPGGEKEQNRSILVKYY